MISRMWSVIILASGASVIMGYTDTTFAYYPKLAHSRGVNDKLVGILLSLGNISFAVLSLLSPMIMKMLGKKLTFLISIGVCWLGLFLFASLHFIKDKALFIVVTAISRITVDGASSVFTTTSYSFVVILYKDNIQKGIGRIQSSIGVGPIIWLVGSSFIFKWLGYFATFAVMAFAWAIIFVIILVWIKDLKEETEENIDESNHKHQDNRLLVNNSPIQTLEINETTKAVFKSKYLFWDPRIITGISSAALAMILINAPSVLVADRFSDFNLPEYLKALTFLFTGIPFTITSLLLHRFTHSNYKMKQRVITLGWIVIFFGYLLIGPSKIFSFPDNVWLILLGFAFFGVGYAILIVSNIPLLQDYANQYDTVKNEFNKVSNYLSGAFNVAFGLGSFIGAFIGPFVKHLLSYKGFTDIFAFASLGWLILFWILTILPKPKWVRIHLNLNLPILGDEINHNKIDLKADQDEHKALLSSSDI